MKTLGKAKDGAMPTLRGKGNLGSLQKSNCTPFRAPQLALKSKPKGVQIQIPQFYHHMK